VLAEFEGTTVFVSHNRDEVYRLCDRIAIMNNGSVESIDDKESIFDSPKTLEAASMTGCKNISKAEKRGDYQVYAQDWGILINTSKPVPDEVKHIGVRAHHFQHIEGTSQGDNKFACNIHKVIEEPFEKVFIFSFAGNGVNTGNGGSSNKLQFMISKDICKDWNPEEFSLYIPPDRVMCMV